LRGEAEIGPVDPEHRDLEVLAGSRGVGQQHPVGRVEPADHRSAGVAEHVRQLAIDPHLGVVVDRDFEDDTRARRVEVTDPLGDRHRDPVPVEAHPALA